MKRLENSSHVPTLFFSVHRASFDSVPRLSLYSMFSWTHVASFAMRSKSVFESFVSSFASAFISGAVLWMFFAGLR